MLVVALLVQTWFAGFGGSLHAARNDTVQGNFGPSGSVMWGMASVLSGAVS